MARDSVANLVNRLREKGFDPRRVGLDAWESRCPVHRGREHALAILRNRHGDVAFSCLARKCAARDILSAVDLTITRLYAGTPNWVLRKLSERPIVQASYRGATLDERSADSAEQPDESPPREPGADEPVPVQANTAEREPEQGPATADRSPLSPEKLRGSAGSHLDASPLPSGNVPPAAPSPNNTDGVPAESNGDKTAGRQQRTIDGLLQIAAARACSAWPTAGFSPRCKSAHARRFMLLGPRSSAIG